MRKTSFAVATVLAFAALPAVAQVQGQAPAETAPPARFSFNAVKDGFLRLDTMTGQVAYCSPHSVGWACEAVPEERAALEKEIARLHDEVESLQGVVTGLKHEIAVLREPPPPPRPPADLTPPAARDDDARQMREDLARARTAVENAWRRIVETIANFQKDILRKG